MKIADIIHEAHATACEKGWHERPLRNEAGELDVDRVAAKLALIHSEITEAWECWVGRRVNTYYYLDKPEGMLVELADVVLRCCDLLGELGEFRHSDSRALSTTLEQQWSRAEDAEHDLAYLFMEAHRFVSFALERLRTGHHIEMPSLLLLAVQCCSRIAKKVSDFEQEDRLTVAVIAKLDYNRTRPHRHGGKTL